MARRRSAREPDHGTDAQQGIILNIVGTTARLLLGKGNINQGS